MLVEFSPDGSRSGGHLGGLRALPRRPRERPLGAPCTGSAGAALRCAGFLLVVGRRQAAGLSRKPRRSRARWSSTRPAGSASRWRADARCGRRRTCSRWSRGARRGSSTTGVTRSTGFAGLALGWSLPTAGCWRSAGPAHSSWRAPGRARPLRTIAGPRSWAAVPRRRLHPRRRGVRLPGPARPAARAGHRRRTAAPPVGIVRKARGRPPAGSPGCALSGPNVTSRVGDRHGAHGEGGRDVSVRRPRRRLPRLAGDRQAGAVRVVAPRPPRPVAGRGGRHGPAAAHPDGRRERPRPSIRTGRAWRTPRRPSPTACAATAIGGSCSQARRDGPWRRCARRTSTRRRAGRPTAPGFAVEHGVDGELDVVALAGGAHTLLTTGGQAPGVVAGRRQHRLARRRGCGRCRARRQRSADAAPAARRHRPCRRSAGRRTVSRSRTRPRRGVYVVAGRRVVGAAAGHHGRGSEPPRATRPTAAQLVFAASAGNAALHIRKPLRRQRRRQRSAQRSPRARTSTRSRSSAPGRPSCLAVVVDPDRAGVARDPDPPGRGVVGDADRVGSRRGSSAARAGRWARSFEIVPET